MKIKLITPEEHADLLNIYNSFPALTFHNVGYEGINRSDLTEADKEADKKVNEILKKSICGFSKFQNFKTNNKNKDITIRFQYDYNAHDRSLGIPFTGVGYILLDELLNGFNN